MTSYQNLSVYQDTIRRVVEESLEVAFMLCSSELPEFSVAKYFDVFNQILPSSFVLCTGYWPFYNTIKKQPICVCARYGLQCRHFKHNNHWIDLESLEADYSLKLSPKTCGHLYISSYDIQINPIMDSCAGYNLQIGLTLHYKKVERGRPRRKKDESSAHPDSENAIPLFIFCRYNVQLEYYPALQTIIFQPNPFYTENYGTFFTNLLKMRTRFFENYFLPQQEKFFTVQSNQVTNFTLVLQHVNLPLYNFPKQMLAVFPQMVPIRTRTSKQTRTKGTQTITTLIKQEENLEKEAEKYMNMLQTFKPMWNQASSRASVPNFNYPLLSPQLPDSVDSSLGAVMSADDDLQIVDSTEFDSQLPKPGFPKTVTKNIKTKPVASSTISHQTTIIHHQQNRRLYRDVLLNNTSKKNNVYQQDTPYENRTSESFFMDQTSFPPIANNAFCKRKQFNGQEVHEVTSTTSSCSSIDANNYSLTVVKKEELDFEWFEKQFPTIRSPSTAQSENEIAESLRMIDEVIEEDMDREKENYYWWCDQRV